jgi:Uma2 family endonuclease
LPGGISFTEGAVSTTQGTKVADVVWYPADRAREFEAKDVSLPDFPPDICVEVRSPGDRVAVLEKTAAYLEAGVREVWLCDRKGKMSFYGPQGPLSRSALCPEFPEEIPAKFLR